MKPMSVVVPAYNEEQRIAKVIQELNEQGLELLIIDDASSDQTCQVAKQAGTRVLSNPRRLGYLETIKRGFRESKGEIIVTMDADGEHDPRDISRLVAPIQSDQADLVMGRRPKAEIRISERMLSSISALKTGVQDSGSGFRAISRNYAVKLELKGLCPCGTFTLEAHRLGARILEVPITIRRIDKKRSIPWRHFGQLLYVMRMRVQEKPKD